MVSSPGQFILLQLPDCQCCRIFHLPTYYKRRHLSKKWPKSIVLQVSRCMSVWRLNAASHVNLHWNRPNNWFRTTFPLRSHGRNCGLNSNLAANCFNMTLLDLMSLIYLEDARVTWIIYAPNTGTVTQCSNCDAAKHESVICQLERSWIGYFVCETIQVAFVSRYQKIVYSLTAVNCNFENLFEYVT